MPAPYDRLAGEYYDPSRHPTCDDLRRGSSVLVGCFLDVMSRRTGLLLELGAGRSVLLEHPFARGGPPGPLVLTDASQAMLAHSAAFAADARCVVAEAGQLPFADGAAGLVCCSLGDPYNTRQTWAEVRRILHPDGLCIFTTPAHGWTQVFRSRYQDGRHDVAEFVVDRTTKIDVPSYVLADPEQRALLDRSGLEIAQTRHVSRESLPGGALSAKLHVEGLAAAAPIVTGYLIRHRS